MLGQEECDKSKFRDLIEYCRVDENKFQEIIQRGEPAIIKEVHFGNCMDKWSLEYLDQALNNEEVIIHESIETDLNFLEKNFKYSTCKFSEFSKKLSDSKSYVYLRSTNRNPRAKKAARIEDDFPALANDLRPPSFIPYGSDNKLYHSSILRIASSKVQVWTHFDLYDNVLAQVYGTKRVILLPPDDTKYLYIEGDKSQVNCFDKWKECTEKFPLIKNTKPYWCLLKPGECLFIPSLWWHNIKTIAEPKNSIDYSIGFNIFWRDQALYSNSFYADGDTYGNKNPVPFESALANMEKVVQHLNKLPGKYNNFYKIMILQRLKRKLFPDVESKTDFTHLV